MADFPDDFPDLRGLHLKISTRRNVDTTISIVISRSLTLILLFFFVFLLFAFLYLFYQLRLLLLFEQLSFFKHGKMVLGRKYAVE